ncbi:MAG: aldehyde dehydrogenase, partial [Tidjanibacter sp.]|nr:aldehyde dehydrogenase [Tidjanibacter sp.]
MTTFVVMKHIYTHIVPLLSHLADNLSNIFTEEVIGGACRENPWFSPQDIHHAIGAIREQFLDTNKIAEWLAAHNIQPTDTPLKVGVIMAGNIPLAGFLDLMCVLAAGHHCYAKPSSKDTVLMKALCKFLCECGAPIRPFHECTQPDVVIASGSDAAISAIEKEWPTTRLLLRGHRSSVAVLSGKESEDELQELGEDLFRYNSMGCRNVTLVWIPEGYDVEKFVRTLQTAREIASPKYVGNYRQIKATAMLTGEQVIDGGFFVLQHSPTFPTRLAQVNLASYRTSEDIEAWLTANDTHIQCVVGTHPTALSHPRYAPMGKAQKPTLT